MTRVMPPRPGSYYWLSFVDRVDDVALSLGVAIVYASDFQSAVRVAWSHHCNPGGEVAGTRLPHRHVPAVVCHRLLSQPGDITQAQLALDTGDDP